MQNETAMRLRRQNYHDIERIIEFDFVRATEAAAASRDYALRRLGAPRPIDLEAYLRFLQALGAAPARRQEGD